MKTAFILSFILLLLSLKANAQQTIDKLNANQLKLPKESTNKALFLDGVGQVKSSSTISDTELGYLEGLSDTLVNLLSGKAADADVVKLTGDQSIGGVKTFTGKLVAQSTINGSIPCPVMTEIQRDLFTPAEGDCVYNSDSLKLNVFDGSVWKDVGGAGGISLWLTANPYNVNDIIIESDKIYRCLIAHTSGVFATDLFAAKWGEVSASPVTPYSLANGGTNKALTAVNGGIVWVDADSFEILTAGVLGQVLQSNGAGAPSWVNKSISAKAENGSSVAAEELQVSNNQLTQVSANKHLIESGNNNLLVNPSFEHSTFSTGWTNSAGTFTEETVVEIHGKKAAKLVLSSQTMSLIQNSTLYQAQFADVVQGLASVRVKSDVALKVCSVQAGVVSTSLCIDVQANNKWGLYKVPFILGATSNGISIASTGAVTGTVYIDDAFVGAVDLKADIDSSKIAVSSYFAATTGCSWSRTSTTIGAFTATTACPGPTIEYSTMGQWQTTDSDLPRISVNNLPAGTYKATFLVAPSSTTATIAAAFSINDGTTSCKEVGAGAVNTYALFATVQCVFTYTNSGNRVFELYASSNSGTNVAVNNDNPTFAPRNTKFFLEYFGSGSVYSSTNADTDWASCTPTSSQGFTTPTFAIQCKRQGGDLLLKGNFTPTTTTAVEARIGLPLWNGVQLVSAGSSVIPSLQMAQGFYVRSPSSTSKGGSILIEPSVSYITFGTADTFSNVTASSLTKATGTAVEGSGTVSFNARIPIEGWQNSNIIIGQFNGLESCTSTLDCTDVFSASVSAAGSVSKENTDWISGSFTPSTGVFTASFVTGIFTVAPNCVASLNGGSAAEIAVDSTSSTTIVVRTAGSGGALTPLAFNLVCQKQGVDYIGKTAKAVASDQNVRSIGSTGMDIQSVYFGSGANCATDCTTGTCAICNQVGSKITSVSWVSTGVYNLNGIDGVKYNCSGTGIGTSYTIASHNKSSSSTSFARILTGSGGGVINSGHNSVTCIGIP